MNPNLSIRENILVFVYQDIPSFWDRSEFMKTFDSYSERVQEFILWNRVHTQIAFK